MNPSLDTTARENAPAVDSAERCANCDAQLAGEYCHVCGQQRTHPEHLAAGYFLKNLFRELTEFDSKIFKTLTALLFHPGRLTNEYLAGRKERYLTPVKLYLVISAVFFLLVWEAMLEITDFQQTLLTDPSFQVLPKPSQVEQGFFMRAWIEKSGDYSAFSRFVGVIGLGAGLALLYLGLRRYFVEHLIFAFHYYTFDFAFFSLLILLLKVIGVATGWRAPPWTVNIGFLVLLGYCYVALRRVYRESVGMTLGKAIVLLAFDTVLSTLGTMFAMGIAYGVVYVSLRH